MNSKNQIIVALDDHDPTRAWRLVQQLGEAADFYKVGLQLLTNAGPDFVHRLTQAGKRVFLDLKLLEIPNSVAGGVDAAGRLGASMVTVHASGGRQALAAAVQAAQPYPHLSVLAVTVITSMTDEDLQEVGVHANVADQVLLLARLATETGCHGIVASTQETRLLRQTLPADTTIVVPGIHLSDTPGNDQRRVATPRDAIAAGASFLVMGRAITGASDPARAFGEAQNPTA